MSDIELNIIFNSALSEFTKIIKAYSFCALMCIENHPFELHL